MNPLFFAIQFLTRIPLPYQYAIDETTQQQAFYWHGVVGGLIGFILMLTYWVSHWLFPDAHFLVAVILLVKWVAITGALHLDGLGDSADAWLGGYGDKEKTLAIMKDPTSGPAAIVWIVLVLLLKLAALLVVVQQSLIWALFFAPIAARLASMVLFLTTPYARKQGLASAFANRIDANIVYAQCIALIIACILLMGSRALFATLFTCACWFYLRRLMLARIQSTTGDTAGALIECTEVAALLGFLINVIP